MFEQDRPASDHRRETFDQVQVMVSGWASKHAEYKPHRRQDPYAPHDG